MTHRVTNRAGVIVLFALLGTGSACSDDSAREPAMESSTSTSQRAATSQLAPDEFTAACLTHQTPEPGAPLDVDLCIGDLDGNFGVVRPSIDPGIGPAVTPDGTRIVFVADGELRVLDLTTAHEANLEVEALAPEWMSDGRVAFVTPDKTSIAAVDPSEPGYAETIVAPEVLDQLGDGGWTIKSLAASPDQRQLVLSIFRSGDTESALALVRLDTEEASFLVGPGRDPLVAPSFSPDGEQLAYIESVLLYVRAMVGGGDARLVSPDKWHATSPTWSPGGTELLWLVDAAEIPEGPAALVIAPVNEPETLRIIVGSHDEPFQQFPAFPDWPTRATGR